MYCNCHLVLRELAAHSLRRRRISSRSIATAPDLIGAMNDYVAALVSHGPSRLPPSPQVEFVENTVSMHPGDGVWKTADTLPTTFKVYVPDPVSEKVGLLCVMRANNG